MRANLPGPALEQVRVADGVRVLPGPQDVHELGDREDGPVGVDVLREHARISRGAGAIVMEVDVPREQLGVGHELVRVVAVVIAPGLEDEVAARVPVHADDDAPPSARWARR